MGLFRKKKPARPLLYQGKLIEVQLRPKEGSYPERDAVLGDRGRRNFWCVLSTRTVASGKLAGTTEVDVAVTPEGSKRSIIIGRVVQKQMEDDPALLAALNSGINAATVFLARDGRDGEITALLRLGPHRYMPRPYWE
ncbi:MAG: hypothetical protein QM597_06735 [Aeromicrobium sp.]|uniref:hypothetical protein n=1 Tax=Aeromicrobium sp. TaxID=1871063 RepID=UPI0039E4A565